MTGSTRAEAWPGAGILDAPWWAVLPLAVSAWLAVDYLSRLVAALLGVDTAEVRLVPTAVVGVLLVLCFSGLLERWRGRRLGQAIDRRRLESLSAMEFEELCADLFRLEGWVVTDNGWPGEEEGAPAFEASRGGELWLVQCRHGRFRVGAGEVRDLAGIAGASSAAGGIVLASGGFTRAARRVARGRPLQLVSGPELLRRFLAVARTPLVVDPPRAGADLGLDFRRWHSGLTPPHCRQCGKPMFLYTAFRDLRLEKQFWSCSEYPDCKYMARLRPILDDRVRAAAPSLRRAARGA